jgi:agmatinase
MWNRTEENFIACGSDYESARVALFGAPFDGTVSGRPGARFGPAAIRKESQGLEIYSPYLDRDLAETAVFDGGDLALSPCNAERAIAALEEAAAEILRDEKLPFLLGGEHLVTLGAFRAALARHPDLRLIHFDAHADLRDDYLGERLSHAAVLRRCHDLIGDSRIFQFGIRSGDREEFLFSRAGHTAMRLFDTEGLPACIEALRGLPVYLTVDLLDPSVFPGTGTPEPAGLSFEALRSAVTAVCEGCRVAACDAVELCPPCDAGGISAGAAAKLVREMLLALNFS